MEKRYYILALLVLISALGYVVEHNRDPEPLIIYEPQVNFSDTENFITQFQFFKHDTDNFTNTLDWKIENETAGTPLFAFSPFDTAFIHKSNGTEPQQMIYKGTFGDNGSGKLETFLVCYRGVTSGDMLNFSMEVSGKSDNSPVIIEVESFDNKDNYLDSSDVYISDLSETPKRYNITYICPNNTHYIAVYIQCQEINLGSDIALIMGKPRLTREGTGMTAEVKKTEEKEKGFLYLILIPLLFIPSIIILSEFIIRIKGHRKRYTFSGNKNDNYQILVPIWGHIKYLENVEYLSGYKSHVTLCTTGDESKEFYNSLNAIAIKYGFSVFVDKARSDLIEKQATSNEKRATSGQKRDSIIRNALKTVATYYVVTLDADSITDEDMSLLVGEFEQRYLDIASIRIVPDNGGSSFLTRLQVFEYDTAMNFRFLCPWLISGACHVAKTYVLENIMNRHSLFFQGNDVETGLLAKTIGYKVGHIPFIVRTSVPANVESWTRQRLAWAGGEFRLYIMNLKFIFQHPLFWFYGAVVTIGLFPLRWVALSVLTPSLYIILTLYIGLIFYTHWKNKNWWLLLMPIYTLFISLVMTPLGVVWYFHMARKDKNYGIITTKIKI